MLPSSLITFYLGVIAYSVASTLFFGALLSPRSAAPSRWGAPVLTLGAAAHAAHIVLTSFVTHVCPVASMHFALSSSALVMVLAFLGLRQRAKIDALGAFVGPAALTFLVASQFLSIPGGRAQVPRFWLSLHITANLLGVGVFLLAGAASGFYLVIERRLKQKRFGIALARLPSLELLDRLAFRLLILGYPLLTFGVVSGGFFYQALSTASWPVLVRALLGVVSWLLLGTVLFLRSMLRFRGRRSAWGTIAGVSCVVLILGIYLVRPGGTAPASPPETSERSSPAPGAL